MFESTKAIIAILYAISVIACALRIYLRVFRARQYQLEAALVVALCFQTSVLAVNFVQLNIMESLSHSTSEQSSLEDNGKLAKIFFIGTFLYFGALWSVKISVSMLHIRLTQQIPKLHMWAVRSLWVMGATWVIVYITAFLGCIPFTRKWDGLMDKAQPCPEPKKLWDFWFHIAVNILTDIWLCVLPMRTLFQIAEPRVRMAVLGVYGLAGIVVIVSLVRTVLLAISPTLYPRTILLLSEIEITVAITVGCLPCISSSFTRKYILSSGRSTTGNYRNHTTFNNNPSSRLSGDVELLDERMPEVPPPHGSSVNSTKQSVRTDTASD